MKINEKKDRIVYWAMSSAFLLIIAICVIYTIITGREIRENNHEYLVNDTQHLADNVNLVFEQGEANIVMLSQLISESLESSEVDIYKYRHIINDSVFDFVEFADAEGMNHNVTGGISDARDRAYYLDAMKGNSGAEVIFNSRATHENLIMFYTPVYYEDEIVGSLIGVYQASNRITDLLSTDYFGNPSTAYLCTRNGKVFAGSSNVDVKADEHMYITDMLAIDRATNDEITQNLKSGSKTSFTLENGKTSGYIMHIPDSEWMIAQIYPVETNTKMINRFVRIALCMVFAIAIVFLIEQNVISRSHNSQNRIINEQLKILGAIADIYYTMHIVDLSDYSVEEYEANGMISEIAKKSTNAIDMMEKVMYATMSDEYLETGLKFTDIKTVAERMGSSNNIAMDLLGRNVGWIRLSFIKIDEDNSGKPLHVIITTQVIDEQKKRESDLLYKSNNDELTGLYNRRAYEDDLIQNPDVPPEPDFVYAAIDVNGLKVVNDTIGHAAGDELIKGVAWCLKRTLGTYGKVYRTGGDEFAAMFFADEEHFDSVTRDLENITMEWEDDLVPELSISVGYASKREFGKETVAEMSKIADSRMYKAKADYYSKRGIDRRGQAAAHTALCSLYTKILKINLTDDSYQIINMNMAEQTENKGFSDKISEWLKTFGIRGQVHQDDLADYLRLTDTQYMKEYFARGKTSLHVFYRRKCEDIYKQVMMEIIPADDYSDDNQSLFLYVKDIDK